MGEHKGPEAELVPFRWLLSDQEEGKTYHAYAMVYSHHDLFVGRSIGPYVSATNPVPVYEGDKQVGAASLYYNEEQDLMCDLFFEYASEARLTNEVDDKVYVVPFSSVIRGSPPLIRVLRLDLVLKGPKGSRIHAYKQKP